MQVDFYFASSCQTFENLWISYIRPIPAGGVSLAAGVAVLWSWAQPLVLVWTCNIDVTHWPQQWCAGLVPGNGKSHDEWREWFSCGVNALQRLRPHKSKIKAYPAYVRLKCITSLFLAWPMREFPSLDQIHIILFNQRRGQSSDPEVQG